MYHLRFNSQMIYDPYLNIHCRCIFYMSCTSNASVKCFVTQTGIVLKYALLCSAFDFVAFFKQRMIAQ